MGDHTEAISIDYDPNVISYPELLNYFWRRHECEFNHSNVQYQNAIFYRNDEQKKLAEDSREQWAKRQNITIAQVQTKIKPIKQFTYAEKYHQKYSLSGDIRDALEEIHPDAKALADSTVATRLNAYLGSGMKKKRKQFLKELSEYGLPEDVEQMVRQRVKKF